MKSLSCLMVGLFTCLLASGEQLTNCGTFDGLRIDYIVSVVETDDEINLSITLKNRTDTPYYIAAGDLPWSGFSGVKVHFTPDFLLPSDQQWQTEFLPTEDFSGASDVKLKARSEISGFYKLSVYYDHIQKLRDRGTIGINWNFRLRVHTQDRYQAPYIKDKRVEDDVLEVGRVGGFFVLPKSTN